MGSVRHSAVANSEGWSREIGALNVWVHMLGDGLDALKRLESTSCNMNVNSLRGADA